MGIKHGIRNVLIGIAAAASVVGTTVTAWGASTIGSLNITVRTDEAEGEIAEPSIRITPSSCELSDLSWSKPVEDWKPGKLVYGYLTISADEGRGFADSYKSSKCSTSGADFRSASADGEDNSVLHVTIKYTPVVQLGRTEEAGWSDKNKTRAKWKKVPYATMYEVRLYQNDTWVKTLETTATSLDISPYIKQEGDYYYEVRAKGRTAEERKYLLTGEYVPSEDILSMDSKDLGEVGGTWRNYQEGKKYHTSQGTYPASQWLMILGKWYYFDSNGYVVTGWFHDEAANQWYYLSDQGDMLTGWQQVNGIWYYLGNDGKMVTGWVQSTPGEWYYLNPDGSMAVDTLIDGLYPVGSDGKCTVAPIT